MILLFLITSCDKKVTKQKDVQWTKEDSLKRAYHIGSINKVSGKILGNEYFAFSLDSDYSGCITNPKNDTLFKDQDLNSRPQFIDFDKDGITDVIFKSNIENEYDFIKFDIKAKVFRKVEGFKNFPEPKRIAKSKYWFSYHRGGCADQCWESDLFYIDNFQTIRIGNISKYYVDENGNLDFTISKVEKDKLIILERLSEQAVTEWEKNKFEAIEKFWKDNFEKFTKPAGNSGLAK